jgi:hypothetical protein
VSREAQTRWSLSALDTMAMRWWLTNRLTAEEMESPNPPPDHLRVVPDAGQALNLEFALVKKLCHKR